MISGNFKILSEHPFFRAPKNSCKYWLPLRFTLKRKTFVIWEIKTKINQNNCDSKTVRAVILDFHFEGGMKHLPK